MTCDTWHVTCDTWHMTHLRALSGGVERGPMRGLGPDHVTWGPMRGLTINFTGRGQTDTQTDTQTETRTLQLSDWIGLGAGSVKNRYPGKMGILRPTCSYCSLPNRLYPELVKTSSECFTIFWLFNEALYHMYFIIFSRPTGFVRACSTNTVVINQVRNPVIYWSFVIFLSALISKRLKIETWFLDNMLSAMRTSHIPFGLWSHD